MGFYLRKSLRVGLLRFNFSKSGIGVSAGIKGLRFGTGPRGNYVHMGAGGLYYRSTLGGGEGRTPNTTLPTHTPSDPQTSDIKEIESDTTLLFQESSEDQLVREIAEKSRKWSTWKGLAGATALLFLGSHAVAAICVGVLALLAYFWDENRKSVVLFYDFDEAAQTKYEKLLGGFDILLATKRIWHVEAEGKILDRKRNAGASRAIKKSVTSVKLKLPRFIKCNIPVPTIAVGKQTLCFLPDKLLMITPKGAATVDYSDLMISTESVGFVEEGSVPGDAEIINHTWRYVNKSGGPDKRFKDNRRIPICKYESVTLTSATGLNEELHLSRCGQFDQIKGPLADLRQDRLSA